MDKWIGLESVTCGHSYRYDTNLTSFSTRTTQLEQLSYAGLVDLRRLPNLHDFGIHAFFKCDTPGHVVLHDINVVPSTIPKANQITKLSLYFTIRGEHPFDGCLEEDWVGVCDEVVRISAGKTLELDLGTSFVNVPVNLRYSPPRKRRFVRAY